MKKIKSRIPELFLIIATFYYWSLTAIAVNWFAIVLLGLLLFLIVSQHKTLGMVFSIVLILINLYLILAMLSEFSEFTEFNDAAKKLLLVGSAFIGLNLLFSTLLVIKYAKKPISKSANQSNISNAQR